MNELEKIFFNPEYTKTEFTKKYGQNYSNLFLLRKDIFWCRAIEPKSWKKFDSGSGAPFPAFILLRILFNYIVYLSGFCYEEFVSNYFSIKLSTSELNILNRLRNALEHQSYNLVWEPDIDKGETGKVILFAMTEDAESKIVEKIEETKEDETWIVNIDKLHREIEFSINKLYQSVSKNKDKSEALIDKTKFHGMHVVSKQVFIEYAKSRRTF